METILIIILAYFGLSYGYTLIMTLLSFIYKNPTKNTSVENHTYSIVIPAYKEDRVILDTVLSAIKQQYNQSLFKVYVIADQLNEKTILTIKEFGVEVIEVEFKKSTKVKSLKVFSKLYGNESDYIIILDADNSIESTFLNDLNSKIEYSKSGIIQVQRKSKNHNKGISFLDAFSEYANAAILSKGPNTIKLSSKLSGSGMILKSSIFNELIENMNSISGFDKEMELKITRMGKFISYYETPYVLDEKIEKASQIQTQRSRWIYAQFNYLTKFFKSGVHAMLKGQLDHAHKVFQLALPPRVLGLIALILTNAMAFIYSNILIIKLSLFIDGTFFLSYLILFLQFIRMHKIPKGIVLDIMRIMVGYLIAIKYFKKAGKDFLHTNHNI